MTLGARIGIRPALCVLAVLLLPYAHAADVSGVEMVRGSQLLAEPDLEFGGSTWLLSFQGRGELAVQGTFGSFEGVHYVRESYGAGQFRPVPESPTDCDPERFAQSLLSEDGYVCAQRTLIRGDAGPLTAFFEPTNEDPSFTVRALHAEGPFETSSLIGGFVAQAADQIRVPGGDNPSRMAASSVPFPEGSQEDAPFFTTTGVQTPSVFVQSDARTNEVHLRGDVTLEFSGPDVALGRDVYATGVRLGGDLPDPDRTLFLRVTLLDADLTFETLEAATVDAALERIEIQSGRTPMFVDVEGEPGWLPADGLLPAPFQLALAPSDDSMAGELDTSMRAAPVQETWLAEKGPDLIWIATGILFILAVAAVAIRQSSVPPLPRIEAALEDGAYRKAVRMSSRVIRRDPGHESAQLARAIAWSQMGAHDRIIRNLAPFLRKHEPSDGTLHYVYGLALHESGEDDAARDAMRAAVKRTPSLLPEVDAHLRPDAQTEGYS
ncbi:MAG: tetratricopeptide repeat protein [Thermoplasmatota archaeon]